MDDDNTYNTIIHINYDSYKITNRLFPQQKKQ